MQTVKSSIILGKSAREVFNFTLDPKNTPKWVGGVVQEAVNENPVRIGTIYRNQSRDGSWSQFELTELNPYEKFVMEKLESDIQVCYKFTSVDDNRCELEYIVNSASNALGERFDEKAIHDLLQKLKAVMEPS